MSETIEIKQCPSSPNYGVTVDGKVYRLSSGRLMTQSLHGIPPYYCVRISHSGSSKNVKVHLLVADAWLPNDDPENKIQVNHIDGNKYNNHLSNLERVTPSQNQRHAIETGLKGKGDELYNASVTDEEAHEICKHLVDGWRVKDIAEKYGTSIDCIRKIKAGDAYFHVRQLYEIPHTYISDFSETTVKWVCERILEGKSDKWIANNSTNSALTIIDVKRIRYKIRYKIISDEYY